MGLGEGTSHSAIGQIFRAEIPVLLRPDEQIDESCIHFASHPPDDGNDIPWISSGRLSLREGNKGWVLLVTAKPVQHPAVMFGITMDCGVPLRRDYTFLLNPPNSRESLADSLTEPQTQKPNTAAVAQAPAPASHNGRVWVTRQGDTLASVAQEIYPGKARAQARYIEAMQNAGKLPANLSPQTPLPENTELPVLSERALQKSAQNKESREKPLPTEVPVKPKAPAESRPQRTARNHVVVGTGADSALQLSTAMAQREELSPQERERLKQELKLIADLDAKNAERMELQERIKQLESLQIRMQEEVARLERQITEGRAAGTQPLPASASSPLSIATHAPLPAKPEQTPWYKQSYTLLAGGLSLAGLLVGSLLWMQRRKRQAGDLEEIASVEEPAVPEAPLPTPVPLEGDPLMEPLNESDIWPDLLPQAPEPDRQTLEGAIGGLSSLAPHTIMQTDSEDEHNSAVELAEIMLSFGRVQGAAQTLADFIRTNPRQAVKPWMKLLEVYRLANMRVEFEALTAQMNKTFNVKPCPWDEFETTSQASESLEDLEHIKQQLCTLWGTQACQAYLHHLLRDNRQGTRQGFPLSIIDEILLLLGVLEQRLGPYRPGTTATSTDIAQAQHTQTELTQQALHSVAFPQAEPEAESVPLMPDITYPPKMEMAPPQPAPVVQTPTPAYSGNLDFDLLEMDLLTKTLHINLDELSQIPAQTDSKHQ